MVSYELDLNVTPGEVMPRLNVSQYNKGQTVECIIYHGGQVYSIPSGATALINGTKPDKTGFEYNATVSGGEVLFTITEQMTAVAGDVTCEVVILKDDERVGTINFLLVVEAAALSDDTVISETDLPVIQRIPEFIAECEAAAYLAEEWAIGPGSAGAEPSATNNAYYWAMQAASAAGAGFTPTVVQELPTTDISIHTIYFVPSADPSTSNYYDEYINLDGTVSGYELVGTTAIDLTGYYTKTEVDTLLGGKQNTLTFDNAPTAGSNNPVKSGGIHTALSGKQDTLTFDNVPTAGSNNPVESGGIKTALDAKLEVDDTVTTLAQYQALSTAQKNDGRLRIIGDGGTGIHAAGVTYDNIVSGLSATDTQAAIDEVKDITNTLAGKFTWTRIYNSSGLTAYKREGEVMLCFENYSVSTTVQGNVCNLATLGIPTPLRTLYFGVSNTYVIGVGDSGVVTLYSKDLTAYVTGMTYGTITYATA